jgi:multidrug resistance efflux pump
MSIDLDNPPPGWHIVVEQLERARTEASQWRRRAVAAEARVEELERELRNLRASLEQRDRDWDALVTLIAKTVGTDEDREAAKIGEIEELDPWHALRTHGSQLAAKTAEAEGMRAVYDAACTWVDTTDFAASRARGEVFTSERNLATAIDAARKGEP